MSNYLVQIKANREWKVLVVDFDRICLMILEKMLRTCNYHVTTCQNAEEAISLLQDQNNNFDIVMIDVYMPYMDGLEFLKHICQQIDLPVIAMSSDDDEDVIKEVFKSGACDYLVKPIRVENVRHVWMNMYRAQRHGLMKKVEQSWSSSVTNIINESNSDDYNKISDNNKSSSDGEYSKCVKKRKLINNNVGDNQQVNDDATTTARKKQRVIWTPELHHKFIEAVNQFGNSKAVPKKILELMNVPGLTRENVASHLQKYRQYHKRLGQKSHKQSGNKMNLMSSQEQCYQTISPINGHNIQAQVISTSSLQVRSVPSQIDLYGSETLEHRKHVNEVEQMLSFHHSQPHQNIGKMAHHAMKIQALSNESMVVGENSSATDMNMAIVEHVEGSNVIYHPLASYAYSKIDSKIHLVENPNWSTFSMEDNVKKEATSLFAREMTTTSIGGQQCANYAYENVLDLGYNDAPLYIEQLDHNSYACN